MSSIVLYNLIQTEYELMQHFLFSLEKENELLLSSYSNDDLYDLTELKNQYADQLSQTSVQRENTLAELGLPAGRDGLLAAKSLSDDLNELIQDLFDTAEKAQKLNNENGLLIQTYLDYSVQALQALSQANPKAADIYDAKGQKQSATSSKRGIVRA